MCSHMLAKRNGDPLEALWEVSNPDSVGRSARLSLSLGAQVVLGPVVLVPPGSIVTLPVDLLLSGQTENIAIAGLLEMVETDLNGNVFNLIDSHSFSVDVVPTGTFLIGDTFLESVPIPLIDHVATGPNGGFNWIYMRGNLNGIQTLPNASEITTQPNGTAHKYRVSAPLSSSNQSVCLDVISWVSGVTAFGCGAGPYARIGQDQNGNWNGYTFKVINRPAGTFRLRLTNNLSPTETESEIIVRDAAQTVLGTVPTPPFSLCLEVEGNELRGFIDGILVISAKDDRLTNGPYTGIQMQGESDPQGVTHGANFRAFTI